MPNIDSLFPSRFLKASDLQGRQIKVTISHVTIEEVGKDGDRKPVVYFRNAEKGLALNKINAETIAEIAESFDTDDWAGRQIVLVPAKTEFQGKRVDCIRIQAPGGGSQQPAPPPRRTAVNDTQEEDSIPF
jgi:hypothetical protein